LNGKTQSGRLILLDMDVTSQESIHAAAKATSQRLPNGLDNLISNAGISYNGLKTFDEMYAGVSQDTINLGQLLIAIANA
jgi:NAD(P)-dependent dehydrogenase (short-subunit alcohol dehydrogenase family)